MAVVAEKKIHGINWSKIQTIQLTNGTAWFYTL
jgi:hypothetical protein